MVTGFKDYYDAANFHGFVIEVPEHLVPKALLLSEGRWVESGEKDWMMRVDAANPSIQVQRHVHIAQAKHIASKEQQASWNQDATRHDRGSFNERIGSLNVVRDIAIRALGLPAGTILEELAQEEPTLLESEGLPPPEHRIGHLIVIER